MFAPVYIKFEIQKWRWICGNLDKVKYPAAGSVRDLPPPPPNCTGGGRGEGHGPVLTAHLIVRLHYFKLRRSFCNITLLSLLTEWTKINFWLRFVAYSRNSDYLNSKIRNSVQSEFCAQIFLAEIRIQCWSEFRPSRNFVQEPRFVTSKAKTVINCFLIDIFCFQCSAENRGKIPPILMHLLLLMR